MADPGSSGSSGSSEFLGGVAHLVASCRFYPRNSEEPRNSEGLYSDPRELVIEILQRVLERSAVNIGLRGLELTADPRARELEAFTPGDALLILSGEAPPIRSDFSFALLRLD